MLEHSIKWEAERWGPVKTCFNASYEPVVSPGPLSSKSITCFDLVMQSQCMVWSPQMHVDRFDVMVLPAHTPSINSLKEGDQITEC